MTNTNSDGIPIVSVSAEQFKRAFNTQWEQERKRDKDRDAGKKIVDLYTTSRPWTEFMLGKKKQPSCTSPVLKLVCDILKLDYYPEMYTIDAAFVCGKNLYGNDLCYAQYLSVLVEHENATGNSCDVETEMWKLLFWRACLKVIIFYKEYGDTGEEWIDNKLAKLVEMKRKASEAFAEDPATEYLFIVGQRATKNDIPDWEYTLLTDVAPAVKQI